MQFLKSLTTFGLITPLALAATLPMKLRAADDNSATINAYAGTSCDTSPPSQSWTVTGSVFNCHPVSNVASILVTEKYLHPDILTSKTDRF